MSFTDSVSVAIQNINALDLPLQMLPLTICNEACLLAGIDSDRIRCPSWE